MTGIYYAQDAYAGPGRRLLILLVDMLAFLVLAVLLLVLFSFLPRTVVTGHAVTICLMLLSFSYFAILKRSSIGTLGYLLAGVRIVDLAGNQPSIRRMLFRSLFIVIGPFNLILNIFWIGNERDSQSLRDKLVGTYVIRKKAAILGYGRISYATYTLFGYSFILR